MPPRDVHPSDSLDLDLIEQRIRGDRFDLSADDVERMIARIRELEGQHVPTVIETPEQLAALPFLSLVREMFGPSPVAQCDYGGVWERRTSGWQCLSGSLMPPGYETPRLPARVLWAPSTGQSGDA